MGLALELFYVYKILCSLYIILRTLDSMFRNGEYEATIENAEDFVKKYPVSYKGWNLLGWAYLKTGNFEKAEESFNESIKINDKWDNVYVGKGILYRKMGLLEKAKENYLISISIESDNPEAFSSLLVIELLEGNDKKAIEYGEKAWALRKDLSTIPANLAIAYHYNGEFDKRDEYYDIAERLGYSSLNRMKEIFEGKKTIR